MGAYKFRTYSINRGLKISQAALTNSAHTLISYVSICSFSIITGNTFSVTLKSVDRAGQVMPSEILFLVFNSRVKLSTACWCTSSLNIKVFPRNLLQQKGLKLASKICVGAYRPTSAFCKSTSGN